MNKIKATDEEWLAKVKAALDRGESFTSILEWTDLPSNEADMLMTQRVQQIQAKITRLEAESKRAHDAGWNAAVEAAEEAALNVNSTASETELNGVLEPVCDAIRALKKGDGNGK